MISSAPIQKMGASIIVTVSTPENFSWMGNNHPYLILNVTLNIIGVLITTRKIYKKNKVLVSCIMGPSIKTTDTVLDIIGILSVVYGKSGYVT